MSIAVSVHSLSLALSLSPSLSPPPSPLTSNDRAVRTLNTLFCYLKQREDTDQTRRVFEPIHIATSKQASTEPPNRIAWNPGTLGFRRHSTSETVQPGTFQDSGQLTRARGLLKARQTVSTCSSSSRLCDGDANVVARLIGVSLLYSKHGETPKKEKSNS